MVSRLILNLRDAVVRGAVIDSQGPIPITTDSLSYDTNMKSEV